MLRIFFYEIIRGLHNINLFCQAFYTDYYNFDKLDIVSYLNSWDNVSYLMHVYLKITKRTTFPEHGGDVVRVGDRIVPRKVFSLLVHIDHQVQGSVLRQVAPSG